VVPWSSDTRSSEKLSSDSNFWYVDPLQKQGHICFGTWSPAEVRSWPFFIFRLPAEAKSQLFKFVDMLTPYRSKVTFVLALDPLQKQDLGHSLFFDSLQKQSHNYLNLLICWPPIEARSHLFLTLDPLQKQGLGHSLFFDSLQKQSHNYLNLLICWPPAEARSHLFWHLIPCRSKVLTILYFSTPCRNKVTII